MNNITFYDELSSLAQPIPKHNVPNIGGDMNSQLEQDENNKFANKKWRISDKFSLDDNLSCLNTKFFQKQRKLWTDI